MKAELISEVTFTQDENLNFTETGTFNLHSWLSSNPEIEVLNIIKYYNGAE